MNKRVSENDVEAFLKRLEPRKHPFAFTSVVIINIKKDAFVQRVVKPLGLHGLCGREVVVEGSGDRSIIRKTKRY